MNAQSRVPQRVRTCNRIKFECIVFLKTAQTRLSCRNRRGVKHEVSWRQAGHNRRRRRIKFTGDEGEVDELEAAAGREADDRETTGRKLAGESALLSDGVCRHVRLSDPRYGPISIYPWSACLPLQHQLQDPPRLAALQILPPFPPVFFVVVAISHF